jgi:hypothetical protein
VGSSSAARKASIFQAGRRAGLQENQAEIERLRSWVAWLCGATAWAKRDELAAYRDHILAGAPNFVAPPQKEASHD